MDSEKRTPNLTTVVDGREVFTVEALNLMRRRREKTRRQLLARQSRQTATLSRTIVR